MQLHDPSNRLGKPIPFAENIGDFTMDGARAASSNCPRCDAQGLAPIFNPRYDGTTISVEADSFGQKPKLMRANAFCLCPIGRKIAVLNQQTSKDFFLRTPDLHDVIAGRYADWEADDPTDDGSPIDIEKLRPEVKRLALAMRIPKIFQPDESRDQINRMFPDAP